MPGPWQFDVRHRNACRSCAPDRPCAQPGTYPMPAGTARTYAHIYSLPRPCTLARRRYILHGGGAALAARSG